MTVERAHRQVSVLGRLSISPEVRLSAPARRTLAYLAVKGPVVQRSLMSMELWPSILDSRARANLRRAIWQAPAGWIRSTSWEVALDAEVDVAEARQVADRALASVLLDAREVDLLTRDLLPGWYDEWLVDAQDAYHLVRVQGLEETCRTATRERQYGLATRAGLAAVSAEPLRQSAVVALIEAHLQEGNSYEALRRYEHHRDLVRDELGVEPNAEVSALVASISGSALNGRAYLGDARPRAPRGERPHP